MLTVRDIERAISQLPIDDLARFRNWFDEFDAKAWDKQFEKDAKLGKLITSPTATGLFLPSDGIRQLPCHQ